MQPFESVPNTETQKLLPENVPTLKDILRNEILRKANIELRHEEKALEIIDSCIEKYGLDDFFGEFRLEDENTYQHSMRDAMLAIDLALDEIEKNPKLADRLEALGVGMPLHDIGKLDISREVLDPNHKLTPEERILINEHPKLGLIKLLTDKRFASAREIPGVKEIIYGHHGFKKQPYPINVAHPEKSADDFLESIKMKGVKEWDPETVRLVAIAATADSYDALTDPRRKYHSRPESSTEIFELIKSDQDLPDDLVVNMASRYPGRTEVEAAKAAAA